MSDDDLRPEDEPGEDEAEFEIIYLSDEDGEESAWGFLGTVEHAGQPYAMLAPLDQLMDEVNDTTAYDLTQGSPEQAAVLEALGMSHLLDSEAVAGRLTPR